MRITRNPKRPRRSPWRRSEHAFSLIAVVSMMVLLTLLGAGLLGLASISLRSSTQGKAQAEARANARMALMIALGDLQRAMGPDRRASAPAALFSDGSAEPNLVGAWETWHWNPEGSGSPDYSAKSEGFQKWLVSSSEPSDTTDVGFPTGSLANSINLIEPSQTGDESAALRGSLVTVEAGNNSQEGRFAYAVMDESFKAPVNLPNDEPVGTGQAVARRTAPQRANPGMILNALAADKIDDPRRLITYKTIEVASEEDDASDYQQELTCRSMSLLTDPVRGGFKVDLTTLFEENDELSGILGRDTPYFTANEGAPLWNYIRDHYQHYRDVRNATGGIPEVQLTRRELTPARDGIEPAPEEELLLPVIAKLQIVFSIVTHHPHIEIPGERRITFFNQEGDPPGYENYGCPHLVYDPVVTIFNPYDTQISLDQLRVRIWDPPVLFGFKKIDNRLQGDGEWLRPEFASGDFHSLARFQVANQYEPNARRFFTLVLSQLRGGSRPGDAITLQPGEVRVFSPWVENNWTWGFETRGGYEGRAFFDWDAGKDFGNNDLVRTRNRFGVEAVPGWDPRAGFQTDHLSYGGNRPLATRYQFERTNHLGNQGWLGIRLTDSFGVYAKPGRTVRDSGPPDFRVDLLANRQVQHERDILRTHEFRFEDVESELSGGASDPVIEREFLVGDLLQAPNDRDPAGKSPFAILTMTAKTTIDPKDISMPWLHNNPVITGNLQDTSEVGNALDTYDLRFEPMTDFNTFPGIEIDPDTNRGFFGASATANRGVSNVPMYRVPVTPAASLGDLIPANLVAGSRLPRVTQPLGSSRAHPLIPASAVTNSGAEGTMLDHVYLLNDALWDRFYFSTAASFESELLSGIDRQSLLSEFFSGERRLLNPRLAPLTGGQGSPDDQASELDALGAEEFARTVAGSMAVEGGFNINTANPEVWEAFLTSLRDEAVLGWSLTEHDSDDRTAFPRMSLPLAGDGQNLADTAINIAGEIRWAGFRTLTDEQITTLAEAIVEELRVRATSDDAPSLTLSEFVNRRIGGSGGIHTLAGVLDTAIERSGINEEFHDIDSTEITGAGGGTTTALNGLAEPAAREGFTGEGAPSMLRQDDLLMALAPVMTVRGDTFRIRAYGESLDGEGDIAARAWCEAVVQRIPEYLDPVDDPFVAEADLSSDVNEAFGRRFIITSFRWVAPEEV